MNQERKGNDQGDVYSDGRAQCRIEKSVCVCVLVCDYVMSANEKMGRPLLVIVATM